MEIRSISNDPKSKVTLIGQKKAKLVSKGRGEVAFVISKAVKATAWAPQ